MASFFIKRFNKLHGKDLKDYENKLDEAKKSYDEYFELVREYHLLVTELAKLTIHPHCKLCYKHRLEELERKRYDISNYNHHNIIDT
jgi:hypothetical protein